MTTKMPDLPEPFRIYQYRSDGQRIPEYAPLMNRPMVPVFTADQMRDYAARHACAEIARLQAQVDALADALVSAESALSDIGDADREPGDDLHWCENRAAEALPAVRDALSAIGALT